VRKQNLNGSQDVRRYMVYLTEVHIKLHVEKNFFMAAMCSLRRKRRKGNDKERTKSVGKRN
jgi:hypothetical protein